MYSKYGLFRLKFGMWVSFGMHHRWVKGHKATEKPNGHQWHQIISATALFVWRYQLFSNSQYCHKHAINKQCIVLVQVSMTSNGVIHWGQATDMCVVMLISCMWLIKWLDKLEQQTRGLILHHHDRYHFLQRGLQLARSHIQFQHLQ